MSYSNKAKVNPYSPCLTLKIGGTVITKVNEPTQAQNLISFSITESAFNYYNDIVFTLFDESALLVEYEIKKGYNNVQYSFGMDETSVCTPRICHIKDYDIEFTGGGVMLTMECINGFLPITGSSNDHEAPKVYHGKISDVVKQVCKDLGFKEGNIVETDDDPNAKPDGYSSAGYDLLSFVGVLSTQAKSVDGMSGYTVYTKEVGNDTCLYFEPLLKSSADVYETYEFVIGQEHENIISFKPEYKGLLTAFVTSPDEQSSLIVDSSTIDSSSDNSTGTIESRDIQGEIMSVMLGLKVYPRESTLNVYTGTNSHTCDVVTSLTNLQYATITAETSAWYKVKTYSGKEGWVRKIDVATEKGGTHYYEATQDGYTTTNSDNYMTSTNFQSVASLSRKYNLGLLAPSIDEWSNKVIKPYESDTTFKRYVGSSSYNADQLCKVADYMFYTAAALQPTAQLVLRGNALLDTMSFVLLVVMTKDKLFHHSSGLYQVVEIAHNIEMGEFTSTLNLIKRAMRIEDNGNISLMDVNEGIIADEGMGSTNNSTTSSGSIGSESISDNVVESANSDTIRKYAEKYIGLPYKYGAKGPGSYDCSGFVSAMFRDMGYKVSAGTADLINMGETIPWDKSKIQPGDILVYRQGGSGHVVMVVDQNTIVHAPSTGKTIDYYSIDYWWENMQNKNGKIKRIIGNSAYRK